MFLLPNLNIYVDIDIFVWPCELLFAIPCLAFNGLQRTFCTFVDIR